MHVIQLEAIVANHGQYARSSPIYSRREICGLLTVARDDGWRVMKVKVVSCNTPLNCYTGTFIKACK